MATARMRSFATETRANTNACETCEARPASMCNAVDGADLQALADIAMMVSVPAGTVFMHEGDPATDFFNVTHGTAKLYKMLPDGRQQIVGFADTGAFLGLAMTQLCTFSAEAVTDLRLCRFSHAKLRSFLQNKPKLERRLLEIASAELVAAQEQMLLLGRKTAREKVASFLLARRGDNPGQLHLPMSRTDIADYLGLTVETVSRVLSRLKSENLIVLPRTDEVIIPNPARLEDVARDSK